MARPLDAIGDWWSLLIVRDAFDGLRRFTEFQKSLGLARNILAARLRNLVEHGILELAPASDGSAYQEYVLTEKGRGLFPVLVALRQWGEQHFFAGGEQHVLLVDRKTSRPVRRLELRSESGNSSRRKTPSWSPRVMTRELVRGSEAAHRHQDTDYAFARSANGVAVKGLLP